MRIIRGILIVVAVLAASTIDRGFAPSIDAAELSFPDGPSNTHTAFNCAFGEALDVNRDGWPDRWTRERSAVFPPYLDMRVDSAAPALSQPSSIKEEKAADQRSLRMELDGGAIAVYSPPIPIQSIFSYAFHTT